MRSLAVILLVAAACRDADRPDPGFERRALAADVLARKAIAYSGYRAGQSPDLAVYPSEAEIEADLRLLVRGGWGVIRLFDAGPHAERVLRVIDRAGLDLKVVLGVWIAGAPAQHDPANRDQIERAVALVAAHATTVVAVSVGNETLDDWSSVRVTPAELVGYMGEVRGRIALPVTTDDSWRPFALGEDGSTSYADVIEVARAADFLALHVYAFADAYYDGWDWKQAAVPEDQRAQAMMDAAMDYNRRSVRTVRAVMADHGLADVPLVIGEIGWKSTTRFTAAAAPEDAIERFLAHPVNQRMFYDAVMAWVYGATRDADSPVAAFTFEAFDEPWKDAWGDDDWGLFDVDRRAKLVMWDQFPDLRPADAPTYGPRDAVYWR